MSDTIDVNVEEPKPEEELERLRSELKKTQEEHASLQQEYKQLGANTQRLTEYITSSLEAGIHQERSAPPKEAPPAEEAPDRDEDPEAWMDWVVNQRVQKAIQDKVDPLKKSYEQDRQVMFGTAEATAVNQVRSTYADFGSYEKELRTYMAQMAPELRANPAAWEQAFFMIKGRKAVQQEQEAATRVAAADDGRGRPSAPTGEAGSGQSSGPLDPRMERILKRAGATAADVDAFKTDMSLDDYLAKKAKKGGK